MRFAWAVSVTYLETVFEDIPQLLALGIAGVLNFEVATLAGNLLGSEGPLGVPPPRIAPPLLDLVDLEGEELVFPVGIHGGIHHVVGGHGGSDTER